MKTEGIIISFILIALMRVAQKVSAKKVSAEVQGKTFFHYGGYPMSTGTWFFIFEIFGLFFKEKLS